MIRDGLAGAHQYFINAALPTLGEFRTLWRLDNTSFTHGKTDWRDDKLPALSEYAAAENVQDETWMKNDGSFLTKYDWAAFLRLNPVWGVYGEGVGSWYVHPGMEYFNGDQLKQELMVSIIGRLVHYEEIGVHWIRFADDFQRFTENPEPVTPWP